MRGSTFMLIYIPKTGAGRGGRVRVGVNGTIKDLPVGIDNVFDADAATIEALVNARIDYALAGTNGVPDGQIKIEGTGSRVRAGFNGEVFSYPTNLPFLPTIADLQRLVASAIAYLSGTGVTPPPTPTPTPTPTLGPLSLSISAGTVGQSVTASILGTTALSSLAFTAPDGLTFNSGGRTLSGIPTTAGTYTANMVETLAGASNSPRSTSITFTVAPAPVTYTPSLDFSDARNSQYYGSVFL